jgi:4-amino-4-deoxy-L-arabinose transferase-like glycosyltransferase
VRTEVTLDKGARMSSERCCQPLPGRRTAEARDTVLLTLVAFFVRLAWLHWGAWEAVDSIQYLTLAKSLAFHHVFSLDPQTLVPTAYRPPLYPALIALLWWRESPPLLAVLLIQAMLGALTVGLVYLIARDVFDRTTAVLAAAGMILAPMTCHFTVVPLTETLFTFLVIMGIFLWGRGHVVATGLSLGLAMLTRPTLLPFLICLLLLPLLPAWRRYWRSHLLIFILAIGVAGVWVVRNAMVFNRFIPVASSGWGTNLLCGTLETDTGGRVWDGKVWGPLNLETHPLLQVEAADETVKDRVRLDRALRRIADHPLYWLKVRVKQYPKLLVDNGDYLLGNYNLSIREAIRVGRPLVVLLKVIFILSNLVILMLAAYGLFRERGRFMELEHITLFPIFLLAIHLPTWIEPRYLLPAVPLIAILAAVGSIRIIERWRTSKQVTI